MKLVLSLALFFSSFAFAAKQIKISPEKGETQFLAIGNPSAIRIEGQGEGPEGTLRVSEQGANFLLSGALKVNVNSYATGIALRDRHMKEKYLEVEKFSTATLSLDGLSIPKKAFSGELETKLPFRGTLELHGIQKEVQGDFSLRSAKGVLVVNASFPLKLSDFSVVIPSFAGITVADSVQVSTTLKTELSE